MAKSTPEIEVLLSSAFLKKYLQDQLSATAPIPVDVDAAGTRILSDVVIDEVAALRADDSIAQDILGTSAGPDPLSVLGQVSTLFGFPITDDVYRAKRDGAVGSFLTVPTVFLVVSGSARIFTAQDLRATGDSAQLPRTSFQRSIFPDAQTVYPALLFSVRVIRTTQPTTIQAIRLRLEAVFLSAIGAFPDAVQQLTLLRSLVPDYDVSFDLFEPVLSKLGAGDKILNIGVAANRWLDPLTPSPIGLRVGIDLRGALDLEGWTDFHQKDADHSNAIYLDDGDLSVVVAGEFLDYTLTQRVRKDAPYSVDVAQLGRPEVTINAGTIDVSTHARYGDVPLGDIRIVMTPTAAQRVLPSTTLMRSYLDVRACGYFDQDIGGAIFIWFLGTWITTLLGALGGAIGALVGAVVGTFVGVGANLALADAAQSEVDGQIDTGDPAQLGFDGASCDQIDADGCRTCTLGATFFLPGIGDLLLSDTSWQSDSSGLTWQMKDIATAAPARLEALISPLGWRHPPQICESGSRDPEIGLTLRNSGGLPLRIWWIGQDPAFNEPNVLETTPDVRGLNALDPITLPPGGFVRVKVVARITGNASYDQSQPPPLHFRILSSAGSFEFDTNVPTPALSLPAAEFDARAKIGQAICKVIHIRYLPRWHEVPYSDPVPFRIEDDVLEHVDVTFRGVRTGERLIAMDLNGRMIAETTRSGRDVPLAFAIHRGPSHSHAHPAFSIQREQHELSKRATRGEPGRLTVRRSLYRQCGELSIGMPILAWHHRQGHFAALTPSGLRVAHSSPGSLRAWKSRAFPDPLALLPWGDGYAVAQRRKLTLVAPDLSTIRSFDLHIEAFCVADEHIFVSDGQSLAKLALWDGCLQSAPPIALPRVRSMCFANGQLYALVGNELLAISGTKARLTGYRAYEIATTGRRLVLRMENLLLMLDQKERVCDRYRINHFLFRKTDIDGISAFVVEADRGVLRWYERHPTTMDERWTSDLAGGLTERKRWQQPRGASEPQSPRCDS